MTYKATDFNQVQCIAAKDVQTLIEKDCSYGSSWRRRGGVGAFMMLARKWDRIEKQCENCDWNIFDAARGTLDVPEGLLDDIADLRCYLLLVEEHVVANSK